MTGLLGGGTYATNLIVNGTVNLNPSAAQTFSANIGGTNGTIVNSGVTTFTNQANLTNVAFSNTGTLSLFNNSATAYTYLNGGVTINNNGTLNAGNFRFSGPGTNIVNFNGGTATLAGLTVGNSAGVTTVDQITVNNGAVANVGLISLGFYGGSNALVVNAGGTLNTTAGMYISQAANNSYSAITNNGVISNTSGNISLNAQSGLNNTARLIQAGGTFYNATGINIGGGNLSGATNSTALVDVTGGLLTNVGTVTLGYNNNGLTNTLQIDGGTAYVGNLAYGSGSATATGAANTVNLNGGTLIVGGHITSAGVNNTNVFNWNGGTLQAGGSSSSFFNDGIATVTLTSSNGTFNAAGFTNTIGASIGGTGVLTMTNSTGANAGALTLSGNNTFGGVNVQGGTLVVASSKALGNGTAVLNAGALQVASSRVTNAITANGGALSFSGGGLTSSSASVALNSGASLSVGTGCLLYTSDAADE